MINDFPDIYIYIYINDLPDNVLSQLAMYADDSSLHCVSADSLNIARNEVTQHWTMI